MGRTRTTGTATSWRDRAGDATASPRRVTDPGSVAELAAAVRSAAGEGLRVKTAYRGRPHWGKPHARDAEYLAAVHPRFREFTAVRDRLAPGRVFDNAYLRRVLGA